MAYSEVFPWWLFVLIHHRCRCFCNEAASCINTLHIHPSTLQQLFCNSISKIKSNHEFLCKRKDSNISSHRIDVTSNYMKKIKFKVHSIFTFFWQHCLEGVESYPSNKISNPWVGKWSKFSVNMANSWAGSIYHHSTTLPQLSNQSKIQITKYTDKVRVTLNTSLTCIYHPSPYNLFSHSNIIPYHLFFP